MLCLEDTIFASLKEEVPTENNAFLKIKKSALNPSNRQKKKWKKYHHHNKNKL
jgi:uncharacterized protein YifE (UPF0438 family)